MPWIYGFGFGFGFGLGLLCRVDVHIDARVDARVQGCQVFINALRGIFEFSEPFFDGGVVTLRYVVSDMCAHGVEVDVEHGGEQGAFTEQSAGVEAFFEVMPREAVFLVSAPGDGLFEVFHEVGQGAEFQACVG
jgi:hypothetical protein